MKRYILLALCSGLCACETTSTVKTQHPDGTTVTQPILSPKEQSFKELCAQTLSAPL